MSQTGIDVARGDRAAQAPAPYGLALLELLRVILVAGAFCGVVVAGLGGRLFMFVLRLTSPEGVRGVMTDDGFRVGEFSLANTLGLMTIGAVVGVVGVAAYLLVKPWLFGPLWLRRLTVTLTAGAIGGALLIHPDGTDFRLLEPRWLAVALCVAVPAVFGLVACAVADRVAAPGLLDSPRVAPRGPPGARARFPDGGRDRVRDGGGRHGSRARTPGAVSRREVVDTGHHRRTGGVPGCRRDGRRRPRPRREGGGGPSAVTVRWEPLSRRVLG